MADIHCHVQIEQAIDDLGLSQLSTPGSGVFAGGEANIGANVGDGAGEVYRPPRGRTVRRGATPRAGACSSNAAGRANMCTGLARAFFYPRSPCVRRRFPVWYLLALQSMPERTRHAKPQWRLGNGLNGRINSAHQASGIG